MKRSAKKEIKEMKAFWDSNPTEEEFAARMSYRTLYAAFIYYMIKHPSGNGR